MRPRETNAREIEINRLRRIAEMQVMRHKSLVRKLAIALLAAALMTRHVHAAARTVGVFVALADPKHTGIEALPPSLGDGDNAEINLYWGNDEGFKGTFDRSKRWKLVSKNETPGAEVVLSTRTYRSADGTVEIVARAYRGSQMQRCIEDYEGAVAHGGYDAVVFIGHDGLMDFQLPPPQRAEGQSKRPDCIALCCMSERYFKERLIAAGGRPVLLTTQLMYPGAFVLEAALETWMHGGGMQAIRENAGAAYAHNQKISMKSGMGVFANLAKRPMPANQ